jgi:YD repeat-containing protein
MRFHGLDVRAALALASVDFGRQFAAAAANPAAVIAGHVAGYLSDYRAVVVVRHRRETVISSVPLRTAAHRPVDLRLYPAAAGFVPAAAAVPLTLPSRLASGVTVGSSGVRVFPEGADSAGILVGGRQVFYPAVGLDVDAAITPTVTGAELFWVLRSRLSAERLAYRLEVPAGASVVRAGHGLAVVRGSAVLARIPFPVAYDAQRQQVPVSISVAGTVVTVSVPHRRRDVEYPIAVDPAAVSGASMTGWTFSSAGSTQFSWSSNCSSGCVLSGDAAELTAAQGVVATGDHAAMNWSVANQSAPEVFTTPMSIYNIRVDTFGPTGTGGPPNGFNPPFDAEIGFFCGQPSWSPTGYGYGGDYVGNSMAEWSSAYDTGSDWLYGSSVTLGCADNVNVALTQFRTGQTTGPFDVAIGSMLLSVQQNGATKQEMLGSASAAEPNVVRSCVGKPVNCATGNQFETQADLSVASHGLRLGLVRTYNSQAAAVATSPGGFGYGWSSLLDDHVVVDQTNALATVYQADGSTVPFTINSDGSFSPPGPWVEASLTKRSDGSFLYTLPDRTQITFDPTGRLLAQADRNGNQITTGYGSGHLTTLTDGAGRSVTLSYNPDGTVNSASDPAGHTVSYGYDGSGNLAQVTDVGGGVRRFGYDVSHQLTSMTDPNGGTTTTSYDSSHRVVSQTDALGRKRTWAYSQWGTGELETVITNPGGDITDERFNHANEPVQITTAQGTSVAGTRTMSYDGNNLLASATDENGHTSTYTYDAAGNRTSQTNPLGNKTTWTYNAQHDLTSVTTPLGHITTFGYDANGNPTSASRSVTETNQTQSTSYVYDAGGNLTRSTDPLGHAWSYGYDGYGDRTSATTPTAIRPAGDTTSTGIESRRSAPTATNPARTRPSTRPHTRWTRSAAPQTSKTHSGTTRCWPTTPTAT